jgi:cell pole-organizing protein PopZ
MEEILASIRRIIAEDDGVRPAPAASKPATTPEPAQILDADEPAEIVEMVDGFDDPQVSEVAANDVFAVRGLPPKSNGFLASDAASDEMRDDARDDARQVPEQPTEPVKPAQAKLEPIRSASGKPEPTRPEPTRLASTRFESARFEPARSESSRSESSRSESSRSESSRSESGKPESRSEPAKFESARSESGKSETAKFESARPQPPAAVSSAILRTSIEAGLLSPRTTAAVDLAFNTLAQTVLVQNSRTLEDLVREMLKPMLKSWLDDNLPNMVERLIRAEIERVSRGRG